jgi:hypothetical protein
MRGLATTLIVLLALAGLFSYVVLPSVIENQLAHRLQVALGAPTKPDVEVSSSFPPELLLGRIDRIQLRTDQMSVQGVTLYNARADLRGVNVSLPSLLEGNFRMESQSCTFSVEVPVIYLDQNEECLTNYLKTL